jgi:hypothetical protein
MVEQFLEMFGANVGWIVTERRHTWPDLICVFGLRFQLWQTVHMLAISILSCLGWIEPFVDVDSSP